MKRPKGVRAAERMTTGSEAVAMAVLLNCGHLLDYLHHMMRRKNCNRRSHEKTGMAHDKISRSA
jgi:hypothetical protein